MSCCPPADFQESTGFQALNRSCFCLPLENETIITAIARQPSLSGLETRLRDRPHLFARTGVFLAGDDLSLIRTQIKAIEAAVRLPRYQREVLSRAETDSTGGQTYTRGLLMGYDFHITPDGPRLIEINTNAGGAFLVEALQRAVGIKNAGCCEMRPASSSDGRLLARMFIEEWRRAGRLGQPGTLAIVDETPEDQYLYPDMLLARELLVAQGIETFIIAPSALTYDDRQLRLDDRKIDMVYNRLTDFALAGESSQLLREALADDTAVVSPSPRHHALYADKRNLALLSDQKTMQDYGLPETHLAALATIPETVPVTPENAEALWAARKTCFFKPATGFGSRAAYRGGKLTKRVWAEIQQKDYVAQTYVPPTLRAVTIGEERTELKYDLRAYTYAGEILLLAARVYQGQTTNFRTSGGGFAPVLMLR